MAASRGSTAKAVVVYTVLRLALFVAIWFAVNLLTPIHGIWAAVAAILISGAISLIVLDRQRGRVGHAAAGFFGRINDRIEASARAEDADFPPDADSLPDASLPSDASSPVGTSAPPEVATDDDASGGGSGQGEERPEREPVDEQQLPGELEGGDEGRPEGTAQDDPDRAHGEQSRQ